MYVLICLSRGSRIFHEKLNEFIKKAIISILMELVPELRKCQEAIIMHLHARLPGIIVQLGCSQALEVVQLAF